MKRELLNQENRFIQDNFEAHTLMMAHTIANNHAAALPKNRDELEKLLFIAVMTAYSTAWKMNKIIIKNNDNWDDIEKSIRK